MQNIQALDDLATGQGRGMTWRERAVTPELAVRGIRQGDRVFVGSACATPRTLLRALEALASLLPASTSSTSFTDGAVLDRDGRAGSSFRHGAFYLGRDMLRLSLSDGVDCVPMLLSEVPRLLAGRLPRYLRHDL